MLCSPLQPTWDLIIHPSLRLSILAGTRYLKTHPPSGPRVIASIRSTLQSMWDLTIHPLRCPASSLAFILISNWCGISQSTPLQVPASLLAFVLLSNRYGISQSTSLRCPVSLWHSLFSAIDVGSHNPSLLGSSVLADKPAHVHPPSRLNVLAGTPPGVHASENSGLLLPLQ